MDGLKAIGLRTRWHMSGNTRRILKERGVLGYDIIDLDSMVPLSDARLNIPDEVLLGNVATVEVLRNGTVQDVVRAVSKCSEDAGDLYIAGAGCGVPRDTPHENLTALLDFARAHKPRRTAVSPS